ncbi:MAG TPA: CsbD family protein [Actinomycetes bacterium]|nr:CsbD family protein [Actinomycetes bacterium]
MALNDRSRGKARNKTRNKAQELKGQIKEATGRATGNPRLEAKGRADQTRANLKQAAEKVKDAFRPKR